MKSDKQLWKICVSIYKELYKLSTPSLDFIDAWESGITVKQNWFLAYYLSEERQGIIIERHIKDNKLSKREAKRVRMEIYLGAAPSSNKRTTDNLRHGEKRND